MASTAVYPSADYDEDRRPFPPRQGLPNRSGQPYPGPGRPHPPPLSHQYGNRTPTTPSPTTTSPIDGRQKLYSVNEISHAPAPVSPRWDSLRDSGHSGPRSPTSPTYPPSHSYGHTHAHSQQFDQRGRRPYPPPPHARQRRDVSSAMSEPRGHPSSRSPSRPPSRPLTSKSSHGDIRTAQESFANFSRPRKQSIRQPAPEPLMLRPSNPPGLPDIADLANYPPPRTPSWQRSRGVSVSSSKSSSTFASARPSYGPGDAFDPQQPHRMRNFTGPPPVAHRPPLSAMRADSYTSAPISSPAPWVGGEELRSSLRSQMTVSTGPVNGTERSSVITKDSSTTSLEQNPDEPSLEDVMGMYEKGFGDDSGDEAADEEETLDSRPLTATSTTERPYNPLQDVKEVDDDIPAVPSLPKPPSLDAEIRQSKMLFSNPAFINSLAHIADKDDDDDQFEFPMRRKTVESEQSLQSDAATSNDKTSLEGIRVDGAASAPTDDDAAPRRSSIYDNSPSFTPSPFEPTEPIEPGSRDRYGFKKESQYVSRKTYDKWDKEYSEYLARRRKKWGLYMKENALMTDRPSRFPPASAKTKKFVRKGIPPEWRGAAWFYYAGGPAILAKHSGLYNKLLRKKARSVDVDAIERDLHRTFPDNVEFKPPKGWSIINDDSASSGRSSPREARADEEPPIISSLRRVLFAFSIYNPHIGYCQSLNFIAGLLLLFVETEEQCFWLLNVITHIYLPGTHEISLQGSKVDLSVLMTELKDTMPGVWDKIGGELEGGGIARLNPAKSLRKVNPLSKRKDNNGISAEKLPPITLCMTAWFMSCFIGTLPIETTLRVWDVFFYEGSKTLFRVALAIFKVGEQEIKSVKDPMEIFGVVQAMPRKMIDANALMETCFKRRNGFSHLSQGAIDERRQERREDASQEKLKHSSSRAGRMPLSGNVTEADSSPPSSGVRRKGTLFGRRKKNRDLSKTRTAEA